MGRATVLPDCDVDGRTIRHTLGDVLYVPSAPNSLLSLSRFDSRGRRAVFSGGTCSFFASDGTLLACAEQLGQLYRVTGQSVLSPSSPAAATVLQNWLSAHSWEEWHRRDGHLSVSGLRNLATKGLVGVFHVDASTSTLPSCEARIQVKQAHRAFPAEASNPSNTAGKGVMSISGDDISCTDDATRFCVSFLMKLKFDVYERSVDTAELIKARPGRYPSYLRVDNGTEYINECVMRWEASLGMEIEPTAPYSPSQNRVAERFNRTLLELARAMLIAGLTAVPWMDAVRHAAYIRNLSPTCALEGKTPYEAWRCKKPDVAHFREFGCDTWGLDESKTRFRLDPKSRKFALVGFEDLPGSVRHYDRGGVGEYFKFAAQNQPAGSTSCSADSV